MSSRAHPPELGSGQMFDRIANRYDLLNRVISLGFDRTWRHRTAQSLRPIGPRHILDLATGTGELAIELAHLYPNASVLGLDLAPLMLDIGAKKIAEQGLQHRVRLELGDASRLPFSSASFDACTMAFGIRNVADRRRVLAQMQRVTRPGGRLAILELSEPRGRLAPLLRLHVHGLVPLVGSVLAGASEYRYLSRSIAAFPAPEEFVLLLKAVGLRSVRVEAMMLGVLHLYLASVPAQHDLRP
ncbi:ubiquinone/menaquinone biosynthesis methyltransferase [Myxococcota bacterium]